MSLYPPIFMSINKPLVITIVGAESSGKTLLATQLATMFQCNWLPEYAREYLSSLERAYNESDLAIIAERQHAIIRDALQNVNEKKGAEQFDPDLITGAHNKRIVRTILSRFTPQDLPFNRKGILIIDGGMLTLRMWAKIKYGIVIPIVEEAMRDDPTDLYLLCRPSKVWTHDPFREAPGLAERAWIFNQYLKELVKGKKEVEIIRAWSP